MLTTTSLIFSIFALSLSFSACVETKPVLTEKIVRFNSAGDSLEGVLHLPGNSGSYPLAVFVHGSGMATRNDYQEFVVPMTSAGIAVFRYDKRGVGASGGVYTDVSTANSEKMFSILASDAAAAIQYFKNDKQIDSNKIILIGGSQAGWIIPEVNTMVSPWLSICISGPSVTVGEEIYYSDLAESGDMAQEQADQMLNHFKGLQGYDPRQRIGKMKRPSLWVFGGKDVSIPVKRSIHLIDSIRILHQLPLDMKLYPEADHGLYNKTQQRREDHVKFIIEWIKKFT